MECASREEMVALQNERLVEQVKHVWDNVPYYRKKMEEKGVTPDDIKGIEDLHKLPFLTKDDLREAYPYGLLAKPLNDCVRIHSTSGTTGKRVVAFYTQHDVDLWEDCCARAIVAAGGTNEDVCQVAYGYGLFTGGLGAHDGGTLIGASIVPTSSGNTEKQITLMHDFGSTVLACTPSYALYIADAIKKSGFDINDFKLRVGVFGAEPWTDAMRREIEEKLNLKAFDIYGLTEMCGPGVGCECHCQNGTHLWEDHFYPEIIDPETLEPLPPGEKGELVFTNLTKWGMPMIRYRTRDLTTLHYETCECGRTAVRMSKILGRSDDMLIIRGVNVFPSTIESIILEFPECEPYYMIEVDRLNNTDTFDIQVEVKPEYYTDRITELASLKKRITARVQSVVGISPNIKIVEPNTIERSMGKAKHAIDHRKFE